MDGSVYLDLTSAFGVMLGGHAHPRVVEAARRQMETLVHGMGDVHPPAIKVELMERLAGLAPWGGRWGEARVVLASAGSEAVEIALKTALLATGRAGVVAFEGGYHGLTLGALASTARPYFRAPFEARLPEGVGFVPWPENGPASPATEPASGGTAAPARGPVSGGQAGGRRESTADATLGELERLLDEGVPRGKDDSRGEAAGDAAHAPPVPVGAVILEPVQGRGGVRLPPDGFLDEVVRLAREHGALVVADEIYTGVGRCGAPLAWDRLATRPPDLVCLGKTLGGGFPLSACLGPREVMDAWPASPGEALHTSTFLGHPVACAASLATLDLLEEGMDREAERIGRELLDALRERLGSARDVRGIGALIGIELDGRATPPVAADAGTRTGPDAAAAGSEPPGVAAAKALLGKGVLVLPAGDRGDVVQLAPPVTLTDEQLAFAIETVAACLTPGMGASTSS